MRKISVVFLLAGIAILILAYRESLDVDEILSNYYRTPGKVVATEKRGPAGEAESVSVVEFAYGETKYRIFDPIPPLGPAPDPNEEVEVFFTAESPEKGFIVHFWPTWHVPVVMAIAGFVVILISLVLVFLSRPKNRRRRPPPPPSTRPVLFRG